MEEFPPVLSRQEQPTNVHFSAAFGDKIIQYGCAGIKASANLLDLALLKPFHDNYNNRKFEKLVEPIFFLMTAPHRGCHPLSNNGQMPNQT